jgi:Flp pilus assembly protein TadG
MSKRRSKQRSRQRGGSLVEMALMLPWYLFFFVGTYDWGFYAHALISTESAARVAAEYTSQSSTQAANQATACILANEELRTMNNVSVTGTPTCAASPLIVTAAQLGPGQANTNSADLQQASQITLQYTTVGLIPIPGLLQGSATVYRVVQMRLRS